MEVGVASTDMMIAAVEVEDMVVAEMDTVEAATMMTATDTEEDVTATTMDLVLTDMVAVATMIVVETDVEVVVEAMAEAETTTVAVIVEETVMVDVAKAHHRQHNMAIQLLAQRLENLMVVGSLMTEASPVAIIES